MEKVGSEDMMVEDILITVWEVYGRALCVLFALLSCCFAADGTGSRRSQVEDGFFVS